MRSREEITKDLHDEHTGSVINTYDMLVFEVVLDVRDLLIKISKGVGI